MLRERGHAPRVSLYGMDPEEREVVLVTTAVRDMWGVGRTYGRRLPEAGGRTAAALRDAVDAWMRVTGLRGRCGCGWDAGP